MDTAREHRERKDKYQLESRLYRINYTLEEDMYPAVTGPLSTQTNFSVHLRNKSSDYIALECK